MKNIVKICMVLMMIFVMAVPAFAETDFTPSVEKPGIDIDISDDGDNDSYGDALDGENDQQYGENGEDGQNGQNGQDGQNVPATGDDTNVLLWAGLGVAAAAGLVVVMKGRRRENANM